MQFVLADAFFLISFAHFSPAFLQSKSRGQTLRTCATQTQFLFDSRHYSFLLRCLVPRAQCNSRRVNAQAHPIESDPHTSRPIYLVEDEGVYVTTQIDTVGYTILKTY